MADKKSLENATASLNFKAMFEKDDAAVQEQINKLSSKDPFLDKKKAGRDSM
jgi:hypothetical protein